MCRLLGLSTSGYYAWRQRAVSVRSRSNAQLLEHIRLIHERSGGTYGAPRVHAQLNHEGVPVMRRRMTGRSRPGLEDLFREGDAHEFAGSANITPQATSG